MPNKSAGRRIEIQPEDEELLALLCRYQGTTAATLLATRYQGLHRSGPYGRLKRLADGGFLESLTDGPSQDSRPRDVHALVVPTRDGYRLVGSRLSPKGMVGATVRHTLAVAEIGLAFEHPTRDRDGALGRQPFRHCLDPESIVQVITDREIRRDVRLWRAVGGGEVPADAAWFVSGPAKETDPFAPRRSPLDPKRKTSPRSETRSPDLVLIDVDGRMHAVEIELSSKSDGELREVLAKFGTSGKYASLTYYTDKHDTAAAINRAYLALPEAARPQLTVTRYQPNHSPKYRG